MIRTNIVVAALFLAVACGGDSEKQIAERLESKGTMELMEEAGQDEYNAPEDGRLTASQVEMYMKVREREAAIAEVSRKKMEEESKNADANKGGVKGFMAGMKNLGSVADFLTADIRAAQELGYNTAEYQWVKERILEASADALQEQWQNQINAQLDQQYEQTKQAIADAESEEEKQLYRDILNGIDEMRESAEEQDPVIVHNRKLLEKHEDALKAIEMELAKYHGSPEAKEMIDQSRMQ